MRILSALSISSLPDLSLPHSLSAFFFFTQQCQGCFERSNSTPGSPEAEAEAGRRGTPAWRQHLKTRGLVGSSRGGRGPHGLGTEWEGRLTHLSAETAESLV